MAPKKVKVGDAVSHDGNWIGHDHENTDFAIVELKAGGEDPDDPLRRLPGFLCTFENDRYKVTCLTSDLVWLEDDGAWMMTGRLLSRPQRDAFCLLTGAINCHPKAHISARFALTGDPDRTAQALEAVVSMGLSEARRQAADEEVSHG